MKEQVYRIPVAFDVYVMAASAEDARTRLESMTMVEIQQEMDDGDMIGGNMQIGDVEFIPKTRVGEALQAIGNDGDFFLDRLEDAEDEMATADRVSG